MKSEKSTKVDQRLTIIGNHVRKLRKETGMNYIDFAKEIGMDKKTYYKVERGKEEYYLTTLMRILDYYPNISLESFFQDIIL